MTSILRSHGSPNTSVVLRLVVIILLQWYLRIGPNSSQLLVRFQKKVSPCLGAYVSPCLGTYRKLFEYAPPRIYI